MKARDGGKRIDIIVYYPGNQEDMNELAKRVSSIHVDAVMSCVRRLKCPHKQKMSLLDSVIEWQKQKLQTSGPSLIGRREERVYAEKRNLC